MKYAKEYVVKCLQNYEFMKNEYRIKMLDLMDTRNDLQVEASLPGAGSGEHIRSSELSDPTYKAYERYEEKLRRLDRRIRLLSEDIDNLERVVLVFDRIMSIMPKHYYVVDRMVFSDRTTLAVIRDELQKGSKTIANMRENLYEAVGTIARTDYSDDELLELDSDEMWELLDEELISNIRKNE